MKNHIETLSGPYSDSLLFQFILAEFLCAQEHIKTLQTILREHHLLHDLMPSQPNVDQKKHFGFPRTQDSSSLLQALYQSQKKLKEYAFFFQKEGKQKVLTELKTFVRKAWILSLELLDISQNSHSLKLFETALAKNLKILNSLKGPLIKLIPQFRDDENVIYFLVLRQKSLDDVFGRFFIVNQLLLLHSSLQQCGQFLLKSYKTRKFDQLLPLISQKINELEIPEIQEIAKEYVLQI